jgi:hypothetical protein
MIYPALVTSAQAYHANLLPRVESTGQPSSFFR